MKRIYIALILLTITTLLCSTQVIFVSISCNHFIEIIDETQMFFSNGRFEDALRKSEEASNEWNNTSKIADMFLFHDYVDSITINMNQMKIYIKEEESAEFYAICSELKNQIASLKNSEIPRIQNII